ncbi:hypothetical protein BD309DRAFT_135843 [Dichomitus squalens]|nr:hypothetical protein BD309DRAFT_135843 [Dichomitus squalens]
MCDHSIPTPSSDRLPHRPQRLCLQTYVPMHGSHLSCEEAEGLARYILDLCPCLETEVYRLALDRWDRARAYTHSKTTILTISLDAVPVDAGWEKVVRFISLICQEYDLQ